MLSTMPTLKAAPEAAVPGLFSNGPPLSITGEPLEHYPGVGVPAKTTILSCMRPTISLNSPNDPSLGRKMAGTYIPQLEILSNISQRLGFGGIVRHPPPP
jgi:hypothetical protein